MTDRSDAIVLQWTPPNARPRRIVLEPRADGGWTRIEQEQTHAGEWRRVGSEIVSQVELEAPAAVIVDGSPTLG